MKHGSVKLGFSIGTLTWPHFSHQGRPQVDSGRVRELEQLSRADCNEIVAQLGGSLDGLTTDEAGQRALVHGPNLVGHDAAPSILAELVGRAANPLNGLLLGLATISYVMGDARAAVAISAMVILAIVTAFVQEHRSSRAAADLRSMVKTTASVKRQDPQVTQGRNVPAEDYAELPIEQLVPGDIVRLTAGDMIPADLRLLESKDLFVNQAVLTGESMPSEKQAQAPSVTGPAFELPNICFMGANVVSGYATGIVIHTGKETYFGSIASALSGQRVLTSFDKGVNRFVWLMIGFMAAMVPAVLLINGVTKGNWLEALLFAVAVAVGLTPEMLPMIVTVNLAKGALAMSRLRVIVKRLNSIQNFGAMDILCTDKTGTLTQDRIILKRHLDIRGNDSAAVLEYAYLNSHFQSGLKNLLDVAVLRHAEIEEHLKPSHAFKKIDEIPFDFERRRLSVVRARRWPPHPDLQGRGRGDLCRVKLL